MAHEEVTTENVSCPLGCAASDEIVIAKGHDRLHDLPGEFQIVRCRACGLMRTNPRPTPDAIGFYYPDNYGPYEGTRVDPLKSQREPLWKRTAKRILERNIVRVPNLKASRMLEIGCASGAFMHAMAGEGWEVEGIEFSEKAAASARNLGYKVYAGSLESAPAPSHKYDLIVGWMVLEHLHEPVTALRKLQTWTHKDGWLAVSVPNAAAFEFRIFKDAWYALHLPNHLYHYTPATLEKILDAGGWRIKQVFHQRDMNNLVSSLGFAMQDRNLFPKMARKLATFSQTGGRAHYALLPLAFLLSALGQTGRMTVWAQRKDDD